MKTPRHLWLAIACVVALGAAWGQAEAALARGVNVVDLLRESRDIVRGTVTTVSDGIDTRGIPYTEITMEVGETIQGHISGTYTFRQFGLMEPRDMGDGRTMLPVSGFPHFAEGQELLLFLYQTASRTGLRTTVALGHGKFDVSVGNAINEFDNDGIFSDVSLDRNFMTENDERMLVTTRGPVSAETFVSFLHSAVDGRWIQGGKLWKTSEGQPKTNGSGGGNGGKNVLPEKP